MVQNQPFDEAVELSSSEYVPTQATRRRELNDPSDNVNLHRFVAFIAARLIAGLWTK